MHLSQEMKDCIQACTACHNVCAETATHCLTHGGKHAEPKHIGTMLDCVEICRTSADFMLRGSELHTEICRACAEVCDACAASCEAFTEDFMKRCAEECRRCADSCRRMSGGERRAA